MTRWPACMTVQTAAEYLDLTPQAFRRLEIPCIQFTARGDRRWLKEDIDAWLEERRAIPVQSRVA